MKGKNEKESTLSKDREPRTYIAYIEESPNPPPLFGL